MDTPASDPVPSAALAPITFEQARVLGCLIEKEITTPENYPLTLNSLVAACNQTTNRDPVVSFDEATVREALEALKPRGFVFQVTVPGARVQKFKHNLNGKFPRLEKPGIALMAVLLLRGAQTAGELRQRTERLQPFPDLSATEAVLKELMEYPDTPLVTSFPPGGGRKATTYAHLLCGPVEAPAHAPVVFSTPTPSTDPAWRERIEQELAALRAEVAALRARIDRAAANGAAPPHEGVAAGSNFIP